MSESAIFNKYLLQAKEAILAERIQEWNAKRNGLAYSRDLEVNMLTEELQELFAATDLANLLKELADVYFVAYGTEAKDQNRELTYFALAAKEMAMVYARHAMADKGSMLFDIPFMRQVVLAIVTEANEAKGTEKDANGKIMKGPNYVNPEHTIRKMLEEMRIGYQAIPRTNA